MGNCQAIDAATLVIQHPCGKVDKFYWPVSASEIMRMNPGHYVALLISTTLCPTNTNNNKEECPNNNSSSGSSSNNNNNGNSGNSVRLTRIKLLRPTDTLVLGQVYRLITYEDVMKGLSAKKHAKMNRNRPQSAENQEKVNEKPRRSELEKENQVMKHERHRPRTTASANSAAARSRMWQPSLQSISEAGS
ncbi:D-ribose-binding periplasmic protein [Melia azedarach]|uniref:D-ribose-binding periplasmic protein n=1 Tax=Melia azedarach TaxID=155640 RepID=A0ACC1XPQ0_MELAZ|nr:D-ribose-binding periplasmic protein [Melia azedarach]